MAFTSERIIIPLGKGEEENRFILLYKRAMDSKEERRIKKEVEEIREYLAQKIVSKKLTYEGFKDIYLDSPHTKELFSMLHKSAEGFSENIDDLFQAISNMNENPDSEITLGLVVDFLMSHHAQIRDDQLTGTFEDMAERTERIRALEHMIDDDTFEELIEMGFMVKRFDIDEETDVLLIAGNQQMSHTIEELQNSVYRRHYDSEGRELSYSIPTVNTDLIYELGEQKKLVDVLLQIKKDSVNGIGYVMRDRQ
ncbi:MAG: hypothetical protein ABI758_00380 [Candidatus Woesebacteria bacterium]